MTGLTIQARCCIAFLLALASSHLMAAEPVRNLLLEWPVPAGTQHPGHDYAAFNEIGNNKYHTGMDIPAASGADVLPAAGGTAHVFRLDDPAIDNKTHCLGNVVIIEHSFRASTLYAHLSSVDVEHGATVSSRDPIGKVGNTTGVTANGGCCTEQDDGSCPPLGNHLHWELKKEPALGTDDDEGPWGYTETHPIDYDFYDPVLNLHPDVEGTDRDEVLVTLDGVGATLRTGPGTVYRGIGAETRDGQRFVRTAASAGDGDCEAGWFQLEQLDGALFDDQHPGFDGQMPDVWSCAGDDGQRWLVADRVAESDIRVADGFDYPVGPRITGRPTPERDDLDNWSAENAYLGVLGEGSSCPGALHPGDDWNFGSYDDDVGQPVYAVADGYVVAIERHFASNGEPDGDVLVMQHYLPDGDGIRTIYSVYLHISSRWSRFTTVPFFVRKGERIGDIARMDPFGRCTPGVEAVGCPHLHFEIRERPVVLDDLPASLHIHDCNGSAYYSDEADLTREGFLNPSAFIDEHRTIALDPPVELYVHDNDAELGTVDVASGRATILLQDMEHVLTDIAFTPGGELYGIDFDTLYQIHLASGQLEEIGLHGVPGGNALVFDAAGTMYAAGFRNDGLYEVDPDTADSTLVGDMGYRSAGDLVFHNGELFLASTTDELVKIDLANSAAGTAIGPFGYSDVFGLASAGNGNLYGTAGTTVFEVDLSTGAGIKPRSFDGQGMDRSNGSSFFDESGARKIPLFFSVLPLSRSVQIGEIASAFVSVINASDTYLRNCEIAPRDEFIGAFTFQTTDPLTNQLVGSPDVAVDIDAGASQPFAVLMTPTGSMDVTELRFNVGCDNANLSSVISGVNTLLVSASPSPVPDIVALSATILNDGVVRLDPVTGNGVFTVAAVNVGAPADIRVTVDTGRANSLPLNLSICQTDPATSACMSPPEDRVLVAIGNGETPTFGVFVSGEQFAFRPDLNRVYVRFWDLEGNLRGSTSVALGPP